MWQALVIAVILAGATANAPAIAQDATDRWPPRHDLDESVGADALADCRAAWTDAGTWNGRASAIRAHLLSTLGLDPTRARPTVDAVVHSRREHRGYAVSNALIETAPGLYVAANVYEPPSGDVHALVLAAHGHSRGSDDDGEGRFRHDYQRLCAALARCGAVVVTWDMVGWAETRAPVHRDADTTILQTWNTMRVLDWALQRDDVDPTRVGMTGSSGGGTQTFLATAVDRRIAVSVPVVMVSAHFFGGCPCESGLLIHDGPGFRTNNVEIAALAAPRPLLLVSCGGDWTSNTPTVEFPYVQDVYAALGAAARCSNVHLADEGHDYGTSKRAAAIRFLARHLDLDTGSLFAADGTLEDAFITLVERADLCAITPSHPLPDDAVADHAAALAAIRSLH
ncbi:MAG: alpha/beta hydrolase family protein [Planctomycetota bacterium]|jgi:hypothetical protein